MKKTALSILLVGYGTFVIAQDSFLKYTEMKDSVNYAFPVFQNTNDCVTVLKINTLLQLTELNKTIHDGDKNIFNELYDTSGAVSFGVTSLSYEILNNNSENLSVAIYIEWCGASCGHWTNNYNFNSGNGDFISIYDLIDTTKITEAMDSILEKRIRHFMYQLKNIPEGETIDTNEVLTEMTGSNLSYFYIKKDSVFFDDEECLSKWEKKFDINMKTDFSMKELNPWLNEYGISILSDRKNDISKFRGNDLSQLFYGYMNDSLPFFFLFRLYNNFNGAGYYAYTKDGRAHSMQGTFENNFLNLTEHNSNDHIIGYLKAKLSNGNLTGTYRSADGKTNCSFNAMRI